MRTKNRRCAGSQCAAEEVDIEVARVVAEELGRPKLKDERELRTVANVRELQGASVVTRENADGAGAQGALPTGL